MCQNLTLQANQTQQNFSNNQSNMSQQKNNEQQIMQEGQCFLTNSQPQKAFPSLTQCYRNNRMACCNSAADEIIAEKLQKLLSKKCLNKFPFLEFYYCFACSKSQFIYTDYNQKQIKICRSFAESLWGGDLLKQTYIFDSCGMKKYSEQIQYVLPSSVFWLFIFLKYYKEWNNFGAFVEQVKPPFFENYQIKIIENEEDCFNESKILLLSIALYIYFLVVQKIY